MDNKYVGKDFLSLPEPHHHVSKLMVLVVILGFIAIGSAFYAYFVFPPRQTSYTNIPVVTPTPTNEELAAKTMQASYTAYASTTVNNLAEKSATVMKKSYKPTNQDSAAKAAEIMKNSINN